MNEKIKEMIRMAAEDGVITAKERALIIKKAKELGEDVDMVKLAIEGELGQLKKDAAKIASKGEKCPNCGTIIPPGSAVCPSCGFAIVSKKVNNTALELQKDLKQIDQTVIDKTESISRKIAATSNSEKASILDDQVDTIKEKARNMKATRICSTVVPNNREDLLNLLAYTAPKANRLGSREYQNEQTDDFSYAYWQLFENCILMAKNSFMGDPSFLPFFEKHEIMNKKKPFEWFLKMPSDKRSTVIFFIVILVVFVFCMIMSGFD